MEALERADEARGESGRPVREVVQRGELAGQVGMQTGWVGLRGSSLLIIREVLGGWRRQASKSLDLSNSVGGGVVY